MLGLAQKCKNLIQAINKKHQIFFPMVKLEQCLTLKTETELWQRKVSHLAFEPLTTKQEQNTASSYNIIFVGLYHFYLIVDLAIIIFSLSCKDWTTTLLQISKILVT